MAHRPTGESGADVMLGLMSVVDFQERNMVRVEAGLHLLYVTSRTNDEILFQVCSIGGLLFYLLKNGLVHQLEDASEPITIKAIRPIEL